MGEVSTEQTLLTQLAELERRVRDTEQSANTQYASIREGALTILDGDGNVVITLGKVATDKYGIVIYSLEGRQVFAAGPGLSPAPPDIVPMIALGQVSSAGTFRPGTTSGTLTELWRGHFFSTAPDIFWPIVVAPNGSTMEIAVTIQQEGGTEINVYSEAAITGATANRSGTFAIPTTCLVPGTGTDVLGRFFFFRYYARRTAGATTVDIGQQYPPTNAQFL